MALGLPRSKARRAAVQALYQALVNEEAPQKDTLDFVTAEYTNKIDKKYFNVLMDGVVEHQTEIDQQLSGVIDRALNAIDPVELSVMRLAVFEFIYLPEIPYRVVVNEAVELAKSFGGEQGHKYVNGVLDKLGASLRSAERGASRS